MTTVAVGFLILDGVLLVYAGLAMWRPWLIAVGALCGLGAVFVLAAWRRYRRTLEELHNARQEMKQEVESIRELLAGGRADRRTGGP